MDTKSTRKTVGGKGAIQKPEKPYADFPLFAHNSGRGQKRSEANWLILATGPSRNRKTAGGKPRWNSTKSKLTTCTPGACCGRLPRA